MIVFFRCFFVSCFLVNNPTHFIWFIFLVFFPQLASIYLARRYLFFSTLILSFSFSSPFFITRLSIFSFIIIFPSGFSVPHSF